MALAPATRARLQASVACAASLVLYWRRGGAVSLTLAAVLTALAAVAWLSPAHYRPVQRLLDRIVDGLLAGLTWVVLGAVYFGLFVPLRLGRALLGRDPLGLRRDPSTTTFLRPIAPRASTHFERQF